MPIKHKYFGYRPIRFCHDLAHCSMETDIVT